MDDDAMPAGLVRSDPSSDGLTRRRCGRGFMYLDRDGAKVADSVAARVKALVIPPAWQDVWICREPNGHIQAVGTDDAGRRQYLYHEDWRTHRDEGKHDRVLGLGRKMARVRTELRARMGQPGLGPERVLAGAVRLLDTGVFRSGGEEYAPGDDGDEGTFGLATLRREHVRLHRGALVFSYAAKGAVDRSLSLRDPDLHRLVGSLLRRRGGGADLLAYRVGRGWHDVRAEDLNTAVKELVGKRYTAKDLRTWNATVLAAIRLAVAAEEGVPGSDAARRRIVAAAVREVSEHLGNTPAVARSSYIDPRVVERFDEGRTVLPTLRRAGYPGPFDDDRRAAFERAVVRLVRG
ncbi:DNA topoisomerase IB [Actinomycetes bacterium KLBMP 9759]